MQYSDKPWTKHYDPGVPTTLYPYPAHPFYQFIQEIAKQAPNTVATITSAHLPVVGRPKAVLTYAQLDAQSDALAATLIDLGIKKGERVALVMPNYRQFVISLYAICNAGAR